MGRRPGSLNKKKPPSNIIAAELLRAMKFLSIVPDKGGEGNLVVINGPMISMSNGIIKAGIVASNGFPADILAKVDAVQLSATLARVGKDLTVTFDDDYVQFKSTTDSVTLVNHDINMETDVAHPDPHIAALNNEFRAAVATAMVLAKDTAETLDCATIAVAGDTVLSTVRHTVMQVWHGNGMPPFGYLFLPKMFAQVLSKTKTDIVGFGLAGTGAGETTSFTVHFADGSYIQTNTYPTAWMIEGQPPTFMFDKAMEVMTDNSPDEPLLEPDATVPFRRDLVAMASLAPGERVWYKLGELVSLDGTARIAAEYATIPADVVFYPERVLAVAAVADRIKIVDGAPAMLFYSSDNRARGAIGVDIGPPANAAKLLNAPETPPEKPTLGAPPPPPSQWGTPASSTPAWGAASPAAPATSTAPAPAAAPPKASPAASPVPPAPTASPSKGWAPPPFPPAQIGWPSGGDDDEE